MVPPLEHSEFQNSRQDLRPTHLHRQQPTQPLSQHLHQPPGPLPRHSVPQAVGRPLGASVSVQHRPPVFAAPIPSPYHYGFWPPMMGAPMLHPSAPPVAMAAVRPPVMRPPLTDSAESAPAPSPSRKSSKSVSKNLKWSNDKKAALVSSMIKHGWSHAKNSYDCIALVLSDLELPASKQEPVFQKCVTYDCCF